MSQAGTGPSNPGEAPPVIAPAARAPVLARAAPPTMPMRSAAPQPVGARWPRVLGIVMIVFAIFNLLGGICSTASPLWSGIVETNSPTTAPAFVGVTKRWEVWTVPLGIVSVVLSGMMLAVGIGLMSRRRWSIGLGRAWAVVDIVVTIVQIAVQYAFQNELVGAMIAEASRGSSPMPGVMATGMRLGANFGLVFGIAWGLALPVFLLVWLMRASIRAEVATWTEPPAAGGERALPPV